LARHANEFEACSITSSALAIKDGATARSNLFAVLRLTSNSNFIRACTGNNSRWRLPASRGADRLVFSFVLGYGRLIWAHFVLHQDMQTVLRCHVAAFAAIAASRGL